MPEFPAPGTKGTITAGSYKGQHGTVLPAQGYWVQTDGGKVVGPFYAPSSFKPDAPAPALFASSFDTLEGWSVEHPPSLAERVTASGALRVEVRDGDRADGQERGEVALYPPHPTAGAEGRALTYRWSTRIERLGGLGMWQVHTQWKNEGSGSGPISISVEGDRIKLCLGQQPSPFTWRRLVEWPLDFEWHSWEARIAWSSDPSKGRLRVARDGVVGFDGAVPTLYPGQQAYFKLGLYRDPVISGTSVVWHDSVVVTEP